MQIDSKISTSKRHLLGSMLGASLAVPSASARANSWREGWQPTPLGPASRTVLNHAGESVDSYLGQHLAPPPAPDSLVHQSDVNDLRRLQSERSAAEVALAIRLEPMGFWPWLVWCLRSRDIDARDPLPPPVWRDALDLLRNDFEEVLLTARRRYPRARPATANPDLRPAWATASHNSYPSAKVWAFELQLRALDRVMPGLLKQARTGLDELARSRLVALVHYPSDVLGAQAAAQSMAQTMSFGTGATEAQRAELSRWIQSLSTG